MRGPHHAVTTGRVSRKRRRPGGALRPRANGRRPRRGALDERFGRLPQVPAAPTAGPRGGGSTGGAAEEAGPPALVETRRARPRRAREPRTVRDGRGPRRAGLAARGLHHRRGPQRRHFRTRQARLARRVGRNDAAVRASLPQDLHGGAGGGDRPDRRSARAGPRRDGVENRGRRGGGRRVRARHVFVPFTAIRLVLRRRRRGRVATVESVQRPRRLRLGVRRSRGRRRRGRRGRVGRRAHAASWASSVGGPGDAQSVAVREAASKISPVSGRTGARNLSDEFHFGRRGLCRRRNPRTNPASAAAAGNEAAAPPRDPRKRPPRNSRPWRKSASAQGTRWSSSSRRRRRTAS